MAFIELTTVNLVTIWFVVSGIIALVTSFFTDNTLIQFGVFVILGVIILITTRPIIKKTLKQKIATNYDRVIGKQGVVTEKITKNNYGEVKVDGKRWTAFANETIEKGSVVKILEIEGVKLKVEGEKNK